MTFEVFTASLAADAPPDDLSLPLQALWFERQGDWERSHALAQADEGREGSWVHAYLHRKEGDVSNAGYWYARARQPAFQDSLDDEWEAIVRALLAA